MKFSSTSLLQVSASSYFSLSCLSLKIGLVILLFSLDFTQSLTKETLLFRDLKLALNENAGSEKLLLY